jgi:serine/threonine-protein kinase SRPK3
MFMPPEVACGQTAGAESDVWALGACIMRLRSGTGPFGGQNWISITLDLLENMLDVLRMEMPREWQGLLWDDCGELTSEASKGRPLTYPSEEEGQNSGREGRMAPLRNQILAIRDKSPRIARNDTPESREKIGIWLEKEHVLEDLRSDFETVIMDGTRSEEQDNVMSKISEREAELLNDLLAKMFILDPARRPTASEVLHHPWFHLD